MYLYGEGWNFGEVANGARGENAIQRNMAGTGIGTFNDRIRDGARGGGPFSGLQEQGFLTGLFVDPNATDQGSPRTSARACSRRWTGSAWGWPATWPTTPSRTASATRCAARDIDYNGQPAGYTADPQEVINYVEAHDNDTLFDAIQLKAPVGTAMAERVRMQNLGVSLLAFGQGVPFLHAGAELLRSKSLDRNSYNSGDWFNRLDFTYQSEQLGRGPAAGAGQPGELARDEAPAGQPRAASRSRTTSWRARAHLLEVLAIRKSSPLFRLRTAADVQERLRFYNTGPGQMPGLIAFGLSDEGGSMDPRFSLVVVLLNAAPQAQTLSVPDLAGRKLRLHPIQTDSARPPRADSRL